MDQTRQADLEPTPGRSTGTVPGAYLALGLLWAINLFNYIDRQVLAGVEPEIRRSFFPQNPESAASRGQTGLLASAFLVSYMLTAPLFGTLAQRFPSWKLIAAGVTVWSLATGAGGLAGAFIGMLLTRCFVGVGEGAYGPLAPTILSDCFPVAMRGKILARFYVAMPVGGAVGYALGDYVSKIDKPHESWRWAFFALVVPGLVLGVLALLMRQPPTGAADAVSARRRMTWQDYRILLKTPSFVLDTLGMTAMSFGMGALAWWMPDYLDAHQVPGLLGQGARTVFGIIVALAGFGGTIAGGILGDGLRARWRGSYFLVSGVGLVLSGLFVVLFLFAPFPAAWWLIFAAVFFIFLNTGPTNTILANVVHPVMRPAGFAVNILIIHLFGDVISPPIVGAISGYSNRSVGFGFVSAFLVLGGVLWLWGAKHLESDTQLAPRRM